MVYFLLEEVGFIVKYQLVCRSSDSFLIHLFKSILKQSAWSGRFRGIDPGAAGKPRQLAIGGVSPMPG